MIALKILLLVICFGCFACAAGAVLYDIYLAFELCRLFRREEKPKETPAPDTSTRGPGLILPRPRRAIRWDTAAKLVAIGAMAGLLGESILVVPDGHAAIRISQISGVQPGTLYAGTHVIVPLVQRAAVFDIRDRVYSTTALEVRGEKTQVLTVQAKEGLQVGLAVTVRYRIDPARLNYIQANLPQPIDDEVVAPVVLSTFHALAPNYVVRDIFSTKREEFRSKAAQTITTRLGGDAIVVKEVLLKQVELPEEYAKGLEDLLLKEQEDDRTSIDAEIEKKRVAIAESQAEAQKIRDVKHAEAGAQSQVIMAKAQADAMVYTLPLKQKQIEQSRLEAEAKKQTTLEDADAMAQAKIIDSKAEQQRQGLLADSEANRIRVLAQAQQQRENLEADAAANRIRLTSQAEAEQMQLEAAALKSNPQLVQLTIAQRLSDKVQIMMVPNDGKFFFANDVLRSVMASDAGDPPPTARPNGRP
ncbi:MAG TPA: SPFH domain-containing protein [Candidatus Acidoferrales bacterium]|nr:SPFH domain-containing protein [Candidatus Acidoferrales bacterium]